jgi:signal transduction histidine kinase
MKQKECCAAGWVIEHGEPLVVPNIATGLRPLLAVPAAGSQAYVGTPIRAKGRVLGVLSVVGETGRQFKAEEVTLLASIADEVGVAVENARLYQQAEQLAVMRERERLARELHDSVTQSLYSLTLLAEAGQRLAKAGDLERAKGYLIRLGEIAQQALKEMRLLVYQLRPLALQREGLVGALQQRLDAVEGRVGVEARLLTEGLVELPAPVEEGLYRIAQEALNNALKHAAATSVTVSICAKGERVELEVMDNGQGFDPDTVSDRGGMGLTSIRERAEKLGGSLTVLSAPGEGTRVKVSVGVKAPVSSYDFLEVSR